jgi:hypothetical protein
MGNPFNCKGSTIKIGIGLAEISLAVYLSYVVIKLHYKKNHSKD